jgi:hypothetical protein
MRCATNRIENPDTNHRAWNRRSSQKKSKPPTAAPTTLTSQNTDNPKKPQKSMMDAELVADRANEAP